MNRQYIGFRLCGREFALDILSVQEIIRDADLTGVPGGAAHMAGMFNLRGKVIPVVDLASKLGLSADDSGKTNIMVVQKDDIVAGLRVDEITGVIPIPDERIEAVGNLGDRGAAADMTRVARLEDRLILLPELGRLIGTKEEKKVEAELPAPARNILQEGLNAVEQELISRSETGVRSEEDVRRLLAEIQKLMNGLVGGDMGTAESAIDAITALSEKKLFAEVGLLTRKLHDSLKEFRRALDPKIKAFATKDMPEAADNLEHVINLTEQAANKTITIVEKGLAEDGWMRSRLASLDIQIHTLREGRASEDILASLSEIREDISAYLDRSSAGYNEILMSQDFQDLTGQMIRRIIKLVRELEGQLVDLVRNFGVEIQVEPASPEIPEVLKGPASDSRVGQQDVDDLLSSFGF